MVDPEETRKAALRRARQKARDRVFGAIFLGVVALGVVSLFYSLNWVSGLIIIGMVILVGGVGWITGTLGGRDDR